MDIKKLGPELSTSELWELRKITEDYIPRYKKEREMLEGGEIRRRNAAAHPVMEIVNLWLQKMYGIDIDMMYPPALTPEITSFGSYFVYDVTDPAHPEIYEYPAIQHLEERYYLSHKDPGLLEQMLNAVKGKDGKTPWEKIKELRAAGKKVDWGTGISTDFKKFVSKMRWDAEVLKRKSE